MSREHDILNQVQALEVRKKAIWEATFGDDQLLTYCGGVMEVVAMSRKQSGLVNEWLARRDEKRLPGSSK